VGVAAALKHAKNWTSAPTAGGDNAEKAEREIPFIFTRNILYLAELRRLAQLYHIVYKYSFVSSGKLAKEEPEQSGRRLFGADQGGI
jgi:hypothetical protein